MRPAGCVAPADVRTRRAHPDSMSFVSSSFLVAALVVAASMFVPAAEGDRALARRRRVRRARPRATVAIAARATKAPVIDGKADDAIWATAQVFDGFRTFDPVENGEPRFRTEARVAFDDRNLYVLVRAFDPHPDSIVALLEPARRPHAVRVAQAHHRRLSRSPDRHRARGESRRREARLRDSQRRRRRRLVGRRLGRRHAHRFTGLGRRVPRAAESVAIRAAVRRTRSASASGATSPASTSATRGRCTRARRTDSSSQLGELAGIDGIASPRRLEVAPYSVAKTYNAPVVERFCAAQQRDDRRRPQVRHHVEPHGRRDGQSGFRPGRSRSVRREPVGVRDVLPREAAVLPRGTGAVSLRPQLQRRRVAPVCSTRAASAADRSCPTNTTTSRIPTSSTILGATKLTGRLGNGVSVGMLDAVTQRETCARRSHDRAGDELFRRARCSAIFARARARSARWSRASAATSTVVEGLSAIEQLCRRSRFPSPVPRSELRDLRLLRAESGAGIGVGHRAARSKARCTTISVPTTTSASTRSRTSLGGYSAQVNHREARRWLDAVQHRFADCSRPASRSTTSAFCRARTPRISSCGSSITRTRRAASIATGTSTSTSGRTTRGTTRARELGGNFNAHMQFKNSMWIALRRRRQRGGARRTVTTARAADRCCARSGRCGAGRRSKAIRAGRSFHTSTPTGTTAIAGARSSWSAGPAPISACRADSPAACRTTSATTSTRRSSTGTTASSARTRRTTPSRGSIRRRASLTTRLSVTATPNLSLQVYAAPFATRGNYSDWLQVANARAEQWNDRFRPFDDGDPGAFDFKQYRSNTVVRWEYRPGSVLYFVWAQERTQVADGFDARIIPSGLGELKAAHPRTCSSLRVRTGCRSRTGVIADASEAAGGPALSHTRKHPPLRRTLGRRQLASRRRDVTVSRGQPVPRPRPLSPQPHVARRCAAGGTGRAS